MFYYNYELLISHDSHVVVSGILQTLHLVGSPLTSNSTNHSLRSKHALQQKSIVTSLTQHEYVRPNLLLVQLKQTSSLSKQV